MPAGNYKIDWSPKEEKTVKTASTGKVEVKEEVNALYEAAKLAVEAAKKCDKCGKKECKECGKCECGDGCTCKAEKEACDEVAEKKEGSVEAPKVEKKEEAKPTPPPVKDEEKDVIEIDIPEDGKADDVVVEPIAEEKAEVSKMDAALEKIDEAVVELKEVVEEEKGELGENDEVEVEIEKNGIPGEEVSDSEIIVQSEPSACAGIDKGFGGGFGQETDACMAKGKGKSVKTAATEEEFCRFAKLSPSNKQKLARYWTDMLGYPKDWVDLLTKDYEK